ncbi:glycolate oxidase [Leifsonia sp. EB41]|uniref:FAD-binding oxidoreductase n=1 Tax=Leifsonia sp. EB41 TaxID=3156260 RepID=UPI00351238AA
MIDSLRRTLPAGSVLHSKGDIAAYLHDRAPAARVGEASAVILPTSTEQIATVLELAHDTKTPVVTRGLGSGEAGGASAVDGALVISTERMTEILHLDAANRSADVQAGVTAYQLDTVARTKSLRYAPEPGSWRISTLGGNIATNAGGFRCNKYGPTGDAVRELTVVTGRGEILRTGSKTHKSVAGLNLTQLFVGSEGILGIITEATLRLETAPEDPPVTALAHFETFAGAIRAGVEISRSSLDPALVEAMDSRTLQSIDEWKGTDYLAKGAGLLIVQLDRDVTRNRALLQDALGEVGASAVTVRQGTKWADHVLDVRRLALPAAERLGNVLVEDVAVPPDRLAELVDYVQAISIDFGVPILNVAHVADGNLHPTLLYTGARPNRRVTGAAEEIFKLALSLGGTITGEHGVGTVKRTALADEVGELSIGLQRGIKAVFDPADILNPGKVL